MRRQSVKAVIAMRANTVSLHWMSVMDAVDALKKDPPLRGNLALIGFEINPKVLSRPL